MFNFTLFMDIKINVLILDFVCICVGTAEVCDSKWFDFLRNRDAPKKHANTIDVSIIYYSHM